MAMRSDKRWAVIVERNGQELARDILPMCGADDVRSCFMRILKRHEIDPFDEPVNCRIEELPDQG